MELYISRATNTTPLLEGLFTLLSVTGWVVCEERKIPIKEKCLSHCVCVCVYTLEYVACVVIVIETFLHPHNTNFLCVHPTQGRRQQTVQRELKGKLNNWYIHKQLLLFKVNWALIQVHKMCVVGLGNVCGGVGWHVWWGWATCVWWGWAMCVWWGWATCVWWGWVIVDLWTMVTVW